MSNRITLNLAAAAAPTMAVGSLYRLAGDSDVYMYIDSMAEDSPGMVSLNTGILREVPEDTKLLTRLANSSVVVDTAVLG